MRLSPLQHHEVTVVRVSFLDAVPSSLVIEVLAVSAERDHDRLLGRARTAEEACHILGDWLDALLNPRSRSA